MINSLHLLFLVPRPQGCPEIVRQWHLGQETRPAMISGVGVLPLPLVLPLTSDEVVHEGGGHAENAHQQVADGQVEDKHVGDGAHVPVLEHNEADQGVAHHAEEEDEHVGHNEHGSHQGGVLVVGGEGEVCSSVGLGITPILARGPAAVGRLGGLP